MLQVQLAEPHASAAAAESQETAMSEALKEAEDRHVHQLGEAYLVTRSKQRTLVAERYGSSVLEGIPVHPPERSGTNVAVPPAPPTLEVLEVEPLIPLTQPLPGGRSIARAVEESAEPENEDGWSDRVD